MDTTSKSRDKAFELVYYLFGTTLLFFVGAMSFLILDDIGTSGPVRENTANLYSVEVTCFEIETETGLAICDEANGTVWELDGNNIKVGDRLRVTVDNNGTPSLVNDDIILSSIPLN